MSDGPHRSLPMKRKWQFVAERADKDAHGIDEISIALIPALEGDCRDEITPGFIESIRKIYAEQDTLLFKHDINAQVKALRVNAGSGIGRRIIENVVRLSPDKEAGLDALVKALSYALTERAARCNRQVEEHYLRESTASRANNVRSRLEQGLAGAPIEALARQILKIDSCRPSHKSVKRHDLDEGPKIR